jgi:hypothetical protein
LQPYLSSPWPATTVVTIAGHLSSRKGQGAANPRRKLTVALGYFYDRATERSELAILDAQTLQDVASIKLPHRVPAGFHGNWVPSTS